ncbi:hypothetical protein ACEWL3_010680, partial [Sulfitobacter sp. MF3-043]
MHTKTIPLPFTGSVSKLRHCCPIFTGGGVWARRSGTVDLKMQPSGKWEKPGALAKQIKAVKEQVYVYSEHHFGAHGLRGPCG